MFVPIRVKSAYSLGLGTAPVEKLVARAAALGLPAMALADIDNLYGAIVFHRLMRERGLRPLIGAELTAGSSGRQGPGPWNSAGGASLVLLARHRRGYENLCRLITHRQLEPERFDLTEALCRHGEGLLVLSERPETLEPLVEASRRPGDSCALDPGALRLLLVRPGEGVSPETRERALLEAAKRWEIPLAADPHIVFLDPTDHPLHRLQAAIRENTVVSRVAARGNADGAGGLAAAFSPGRFFPGPREFERRFGDVPEAVREAHRLAELCDLDLSRGKPIFPKVPALGASQPNGGESPFSALSRLAFEGLRRRSGPLTPAALERLTTELSMIDRLGFTEYFLVVGDLVRRARERGIATVGRGSGASSMVAYALGVTNVDPLAYGLYFERFLHPGRADLPDIDIDLCWIRRDEVIADVYKSYGADRVAMISSHVTFQPRSAFREALKAFGLPPEAVDRCSKRIPHHFESRSGAPVEKTGGSSGPLRDAIRSSPLGRDIPLAEEPYRSAVPLAERLIGLPHHLSIHPGGIVIGDRPLDGYVPLEYAAKGLVVTQYDMYSIEDVGLVKIDLLGNRCLTEIQETIERAGLDLESIPDRDPAAVELLCSGRTVGCFQIESPAMRSLLRQLKVRSIRDCIAAVAIIRPGPAEGGMKERFILRVNGAEPAEFLHPALRPVLEENHGVILYEEDVMRVIAALTGWPLAEGDSMRSALKKCRSDEERRDLENRFASAAIRNGIEPDVAAAAWRGLLQFSRYCFNKAHASGYGLLAYQSAYLKAHCPAEFACALLNHHAGMYSLRTIAEEARRMGVAILPPCANRSEGRHILEEAPGAARKAIRLGLLQVKGLSHISIEAILAGRPFRSLNDLLRRAQIPRRELEALILAGAIDFTGLNRPQLLWELESTYDGERGRGDLGLLAPEDCRLEYPPLPDYTPLQKVIHELRHLELALTAHPLALLADRPELKGRVPAAAITGAAPGKPAGGAAGSPAARPGQRGRRVRVAGLLAACRRARTRSGRMMEFVTLEDESGVIEGTLFPEVFERHGSALQSLGPYVAEGTVEDHYGAVTVNLQWIRRLPFDTR
ncbi:MAG: DNA polymerase III subunit alpha [Planctomycetes bacterium]|nr:DNA polymerase III subunit alpha [Planctomycetota bacterium]